jgi:outer membrane protein TolC
LINYARTQLVLSPKRVVTAAFATFLILIFSACSFQTYSPKPIDSAAITTKYESKDPASKRFQEYLLSNGYPANRLPLQQWNLDDLTYCALFFHPSLDTARAQLSAAKNAESSAAEKAMPSINGHMAHSDDPDPTKKPFAFGLSIDIPIETANKRDIRIENAQHLSEIAKLQIAQTAWQLRYNIAQSLIEYQFNQQQLDILNKEIARRQEIVAIHQKRLDIGLASNVELSNAKLLLQISLSELNAKQQNKLILMATLAKNLGLPLSKVQDMRLTNQDNIKVLNLDQTNKLQNTALLNRLDIRIALERYAIAETKLKLEIAKQYPDLTISPGFAYEFGDNIWSLGLSGLLSLLSKNKLAIVEATQLREVEAAQFEALQTQVLAELATKNAEVNQAQIALQNQETLLMHQQDYTKRMVRKLTSGEIDRLELALVNLENITAEKHVALARFQLNTLLNQLENILQIPLSAGSGVKYES